jgi:cytochrome c-type biogenesis protein CcmH/NrfF
LRGEAAMYTMQASTTLTDRRMARALVGAFFCLALLGAAFLTAAPALAADQQAAPVPDEGKVLERIQQIGMKIKAPCHPDKLVAQHESPEVIQIKKEIRRMLLEGKSEREILDAMAADGVSGASWAVRPPCWGSSS